MGLRDFFTNLGSATDQAAGFANTAEAIRRQAALQQVGQDIQPAVQSGDYSKVLSGFANAGDSANMTKTLDTIINANAKKDAAKAKGQPASQTERDLYQQLTGKPAPMAATADDLKDYGKKFQIDANFDKSQSRLQGGQLQKFAGDFRKPLEKIDTEFDNLGKSLSNQIALFEKNPTSGAARVLGTAIARGSGEKGVLTENDVKNYNIHTLGANVQQVLNYLNGDAKELDDPNSPQAQEVLRLAKGVLGSINDRKKYQLDQAFTDSAVQNNDLVGHPKYDQMVQKWAKKAGYDNVKKNDDGSIEFVKGKSTSTGDYAQYRKMAAGLTGDDLKVANGIIDKYEAAGTPLPAQYVQQFQALGAQKAGQ